MENARYLYCMVREGGGLNQKGITGMEGDTVYAVGYGGIAAVVSRASTKKYPLTRGNLLSHQKVIEEVMNISTVLPVRFSTVATSEEAITRVLEERYGEFADLLKDMEGKAELGLKALWKDMAPVFVEIREDEDIKRASRKTAPHVPDAYTNTIALGKKVEEKLRLKKEAESKTILAHLRGVVSDVKTNRVFGDAMVLNAAFLVDGKKTKEFDERIRDLYETQGERMNFRCVGPMPPFNFVNIVITWKEGVKGPEIKR